MYCGEYEANGMPIYILLSIKTRIETFLLQVQLSAAAYLYPTIH